MPSNERYIALGNLASGVAKALQSKADREYEEKKSQHDMITNMVSKGIESGTIKDPDAAFQFLIGGGKTGKKPKDLPPMLKTLIGSTKHLFGKGGSSEADAVAGRMASAQPPDQGPSGQPQVPQFTSQADRDTQATATTIGLEKRRAAEITEPAAVSTQARELERIKARNEGRFGPGTLIGQVNTAMDAFETKNGRPPTKEEELAIVNGVRETWQSAGKKGTDYKQFENTWLEDAGQGGALTAGQRKVEMLKARKAWSLQESSGEKLGRAQALAKYKHDLAAYTPDDVDRISQSVTIGDKTTRYVDLAGISGTDEKNAASRAAIAQGIIPVSGKQAEQLEAADTSSAHLKDFLDTIKSKLPADAASRPLGAIENKLSQFFQTDEELSAAMAWDVTVLPLIRAMQVSGRITNLEFQTALNARPKLTDTVGRASKAVEFINQMLTRVSTPILRRGSGKEGATTPQAGAGSVPPEVTSLLKGKKATTPDKPYKLSDGSEWDVSADGKVTPHKKKAA